MKFAIFLKTPILKNICERLLLKKFVTLLLQTHFKRMESVKLFSSFLWITGGISNVKHSSIKIPGIRLWNYLKTLHKNWFLLRISSLNLTKSAGNCGIGLITEEILNRKLHFFVQWGFIRLVGFDFNLTWGFWLSVTDTKSYFALEKCDHALPHLTISFFGMFPIMN